MITWLGQAGIVLAVGFIAVFGGVRFVERSFRFIDRPATTPSDATALVAAGSTLRGGAWIGALERTAVYATILAGFPAGIAVVVAMKGLARYPELKVSSAGAAERFIIGTFLSILLASACAGLAICLVSLVP